MAYRPPQPGDPIIYPRQEALDPHGLNTDDRHQLGMVALLYKVFAGLTVLTMGWFLVSVLIEAVFPSADRTVPVDPTVDAIMLVFGVGGFAVSLLVAAVAWIGAVQVDKRRTWGMALAVAILMLPFFPLGTGLGIYALTVINRPTVKEAFRRTG